MSKEQKPEHPFPTCGPSYLLHLVLPPVLGVEASAPSDEAKARLSSKLVKSMMDEEESND